MKDVCPKATSGEWQHRFETLYRLIQSKRQAYYRCRLCGTERS